MYSILRVAFLTLVCAVLVAAEENIPLRTIAFAQDTMANDFRKAQVYAARDEAAKHPGLSFVYSDAKGQTSLLIRQIGKFIAAEVDVLIVGTNDAEAVVPVVSKAYRAGIPVIILDRGIAGNDYTTFIHSDNVKIGAIAADFIAQRLNGKGRVLLFEGIQEADVTQHRSRGFLNGIAEYKQIEVIKRTGNFLRRDAIRETEKLVAEGIRIDAIFSESDSMLSGVRSVQERHGIDPSSILSVGCDYISEAREAIRNGTQAASVLFPLGGRQSVEIAMKILNGESVPKDVIIPVQLITKENVEHEEPIF